MAKQKTDEELNENIRLILLEYVGLPSQHVEIYSASGSVTLTGSVPTLEARDNILELVKKVPKVKDVVSFLELDHLGLSP